MAKEYFSLPYSLTLAPITERVKVFDGYITSSPKFTSQLSIKLWLKASSTDNTAGFISFSGYTTSIADLEIALNDEVTTHVLCIEDDISVIEASTETLMPLNHIKIYAKFNQPKLLSLQNLEVLLF